MVLDDGEAESVVEMWGWSIATFCYRHEGLHVMQSSGST